MKNQFAIIGYGRLGRTLAQVVKSWRPVVVIENEASRRQQAIDDGFRVVPLNAVGEYQTVIVCVPIRHFEAVVREIAPKLAPGAVLVDTCSVKVHPVEVMTRLVPTKVQVLATHPLFGPDSVKKGLKGLGMILCPVRIDEAQLDAWRNFWSELGLRVLEITPDEHDRAGAYTLGLTHVVGRVLGELKLTPEDTATAGYKALIEVMQQTGNDSWELFSDMQHFNPHSREMRDRLTIALHEVRAKLDQAIDKKY